MSHATTTNKSALFLRSVQRNLPLPKLQQHLSTPMLRDDTHRCPNAIAESRNTTALHVGFRVGARCGSEWKCNNPNEAKSNTTINPRGTRQHFLTTIFAPPFCPPLPRSPTTLSKSILIGPCLKAREDKIIDHLHQRNHNNYHLHPPNWMIQQPMEPQSKSALVATIIVQRKERTQISVEIKYWEGNNNKTCSWE